MLACLALASCRGTTPQQGDAAASATPIDWRFVGDDSFHDFELRRVVEDMLLDYEKDTSRESILVDAASDLHDWYVGQGFPEARVRYRIDPSMTPTRVVFETEEGPRVTVADVHIKHNEAFRAAELLPLWSRTKSGLLGTGDPYFVESDLAAFALAMKGKYMDSGFLDVEVTGPFIEREKGATEARISYEVTEGPRFILTEVTVTNALSEPLGGFATENLLGKPYQTVELSTVRENLRKRLQDRGYPNPTVRVDVEVFRDAANKSFTVHAKIDGEPNARRRIRSVRIEGNERTAHRIIARRVEFKEGEWYDGSKVDATLRSLYLTGIFSKVEVVREETEDPDGDVLVVRLTETRSREVGVLIGYGSYERARAALFFADHNLFGIGQSLRVGGKVSQRSYGADITWTEPRLWATETGLSVTTFIKRREEPTYTDISRGLSAALSRRILPGTQVRLGYSIEDRDGSDIDPSLRSLIQSEFVVGKVFSELAYDDMDSRLIPTKGKRAMLRFEHADPDLGGDLRFNRVSLQSAWHYPIATGWVFSLGAQSALIWPGLGNTLPVQERFFNGGESSVRSFKESQLGPRTALGNPSGGQFRNVFNAELRFPLFGPIEGACFADAGNIGTDADEFGLSNMRYALGGGIRFVLPIGPVRFDAGWNPSPDDTERDYALHISVGYPF